MLAGPPAKIALCVFLAVATSLFALFISAYAMRIHLLDWTPLPQPKLLSLNTGMLVLASVAMQGTVFAARRGDVDSVRMGLVGVGVLTTGFLVGQLVVWGQLADAGYLVATSAATAFFYLLTAVHGVHVLGRPRGVGPHMSASMARRECAGAQAECRALHDLLALPAGGLAGSVRAACVELRGIGDMHHFGCGVTRLAQAPIGDRGSWHQTT